MGNSDGRNDKEEPSLGVRRFALALLLILAIAVAMLLFIRYAVL